MTDLDDVFDAVRRDGKCYTGTDDPIEFVVVKSAYFEALAERLQELENFLVKTKNAAKAPAKTKRRPQPQRLRDLVPILVASLRNFGVELVPAEAYYYSRRMLLTIRQRAAAVDLELPADDLELVTRLVQVMVALTSREPERLDTHDLGGSCGCTHDPD